jgi:type I restriction enzyme S subunit
VPAHCEVMRLKRAARLSTDRAADRSFPVGLEHIESWTGRFIEAETEFEGDGVAFRPGDILFGKLRPYLAKAWLADRPGEAVGDFHVICSLPPHVPEFLQRVLLSREAISLIDGSTYGSKMPRASWEFIGSLAMAFPPPAEQRAIAAFLDRECGKIDALVAEQERLIALLKEKRQAVISHAVTKGLDPTAPMKDSGVPWLGQVPAHREVKRLKRGARIVYGLGQPPEYQPEGTPFVRATNVKQGFLSTDSLTFVDPTHLPAHRITRLEVGDIVVVRSCAYTGDSAIVTVEWGGAISGFDMVVQVQPPASPAFVAAALLSRYVLEGQIRLLRLRAAQPHLNAEELGDIVLAVPPIDEQEAVAAIIGSQCGRLDTLITEAERAIALLKERRAALISAAVTGKIDVRGLVPAEAARAA